jgi:hypothetical protein
MGMLSAMHANPSMHSLKCFQSSPVLIYKEILRSYYILRTDSTFQVLQNNLVLQIYWYVA